MELKLSPRRTRVVSEMAEAGLDSAIEIAQHFTEMKDGRMVVNASPETWKNAADGAAEIRQEMKGFRRKDYYEFTYFVRKELEAHGA